MPLSPSADSKVPNLYFTAALSDIILYSKPYCLWGLPALLVSGWYCGLAVSRPHLVYFFLLNATQKVGDWRAPGKPCNNVMHQQFCALDSALGLGSILI